MSFRISMKRVLLAAGVVAMSIVTAPAQAQFGEAAGIAEAMQQDYFRRDIQLFSDGLHLDDTQRTIIEALYGDYEQAFEDGLAGMRKRIEDMREELQNQDVDRVLRLVFKPIEEWSVEKRALGDQFLENVRVVLTPEQQEMWPKFTRHLFREKTLPRGHLSGESLNLFHVVRDMNLNEPETSHIQPALDEYDIALDTALRNRQKSLTSSQGDMLKSFSEQNPSVSLAILQRQIEMSIAVRNVNDNYIDRLAEVMPDGRQEEFAQKALERAYPRVHRPHPVLMIFKAARELEGLSPETMNAVISLETSLIVDLKAVNEQLEAATRDWEPNEQRKRAESFARRMSGQQPEQIDDPCREVYLKRDEIARSYIKQLRAILTAEQFAQLPGAARWLALEETTKESAGAAAGAGARDRVKPAGTQAPAPKPPVPEATPAPPADPDTPPESNPR